MKSIKINWFLIPVILLSNFLINSNSFSTTHTVNVNNNFFTPPNLNVNVGDTIMWSWNQGSHTTTCNGSPNTSRPAGAAPWDAPMNSSNSTFTYVVTVAGTYNYKCFFHNGMYGTFTASTPVIALNLKLSYEGFWNGTTNKADTVKVYIHNISSPYNIIDSAKKYITSSSIVLLSFNNTGSGSYYIDVRHRNALQTWSSSAETFTLGSTTNYDFTTAQNKSYGNNQILKLGRWCFFSGDVNQDEIIDVSDQSLIDNDVYNLVSGYVNTDLDGNTIVDLSDAAIADNNGFNFVGVIKP